MAATPDDTRWGTIFMGPTPDRESTIDKVTEDRQRELWNRRTEAEYMERVRAKATLRVQAMLDQARTQAEAIRGTARQWADKLKAECEGLHEQARKTREDAEVLLAQAEQERAAGREEGYKAGAEQAFLELDVHRTALEDATASVLKTIEEQGAVLFDAWRRDLAALTRDCVESLTGWVLTEERNAVLEGLLAAAVQELTERRRLEIRVNPVDCDAVTLVIESAKARFPDVKHWEVRADETIGQGGLIVESNSGMVDNRLEVRRQAVDEILRHLTLPAGPADAAALETVARRMEATGVNALAAKSEERAAQTAAEEAARAEMEEAAPAGAATEGAEQPSTEGPGIIADAGQTPISLLETDGQTAPEALAESEPVPAAGQVDPDTGPEAIGPFDPATATPPAQADAPAPADESAPAVAALPAAPAEAAPSPLEAAELMDAPAREDDVPVLDVLIPDAPDAEATPQPAPEAGRQGVHALEGAAVEAAGAAEATPEEVTPHGA